MGSVNVPKKTEVVPESASKGTLFKQVLAFEYELAEKSRLSLLDEITGPGFKKLDVADQALMLTQQVAMQQVSSTLAKRIARTV